MNNLEANENRSEFQQIIEKLEQIEAELKILTGKGESNVIEKMLDNADMCALFGITKRTLQRYRQKGVVPYYMMSGKPYYKVGEIQECLKRILNDRNNRKSK